MNAVSVIRFLPALGMVWRGMWNLAYVPAADDSPAEETPQAA